MFYPMLTVNVGDKDRPRLSLLRHQGEGSEAVTSDAGANPTRG